MARRAQVNVVPELKKMMKEIAVMIKNWRQNGIQTDAAKVWITVAMENSINAIQTKTTSIAQNSTSARKVKTEITMEFAVMDKNWHQNGIQTDAAKAGIIVAMEKTISALWTKTISIATKVSTDFFVLTLYMKINYGLIRLTHVKWVAASP